MTRSLLIIDDNKNLCESLARNFADSGMNALIATDRASAIRLFQANQIAAVLLDIVVGPVNGIDMLGELRAARPEVPIIMITGYATVETAVQSLKLGATDYVKKPLDFDVLEKVVNNAIRVATLREENVRLRKQLAEHQPQIVMQSAAMLSLMQQVEKLAPTNLPILILGQHGTGKELLADALHHGSRRSDRGLVKVNCAAFPETLLDNELFGHERGSFTGAETQFKGVFERTNGGTLFLDEIGDMPLSIQAKILRTLQNNEIRRIGGTQTLAIDVRFLAATNLDISRLIAQNRFREDLYYRLSGAVLTVPSLAERREDLPELARSFVAEYCASNAIGPKKLTNDLVAKLLKYDWPGNIRELKNAMSYACAIASGDSLSVQDLPPTIQEHEQPGAQAVLNVRELTEKALIIRTLQQARFNKKAAAVRLSMSRKTLYNKLARYDIAPDPVDE